MKRIKLFREFDGGNLFGKISESISSELEKIREYGYIEMERYLSGPYTLLLLHNTNEDIYEISLTTDEDDFTTFDSQISRSPRYNLNFRELSRDLIRKVGEWLQNYGDLYVGSFNQERTEKYHRIFSGLGFNLSPIQYNENEDLPPSWDFVIQKNDPDL